MAESAQHRNLRRLLCRRFVAMGAEITHVAGDPRYDEPLKIGDHRPDVTAWLPGRRLVGEAKLGPELYGEHTLQQLRDFTRFRPKGRRSTLFLAVPSAYHHEAREAVADVGGNPRNLQLVSPPRRRRGAKASRAATRLTASRGPGTSKATSPLFHGDVARRARQAALRQLRGA